MKIVQNAKDFVTYNKKNTQSAPLTDSSKTQEALKQNIDNISADKINIGKTSKFDNIKRQNSIIGYIQNTQKGLKYFLEQNPFNKDNISAISANMEYLMSQKDISFKDIKKIDKINLELKSYLKNNDIDSDKLKENMTYINDELDFAMKNISKNIDKALDTKNIQAQNFDFLAFDFLAKNASSYKNSFGNISEDRVSALLS